MGAATRPPRGKLRALSRAVRGKGDPRASSSWRGPLGPCPGGRRRPVSLGPVASRRERPFRPRVLDPRAPALRVPPSRDPGHWDAALWASQALSSLQVGPAGSLVAGACAGARGGWAGLGWAGRALPGLLGGPLFPAPAPPHSASAGNPGTWGCSPPSPGRRGGGVPAPASERRGFFGAGQAENPPGREALPLGSLAAGRPPPCGTAFPGGGAAGRSVGDANLVCPG